MEPFRIDSRSQPPVVCLFRCPSLFWQFPELGKDMQESSLEIAFFVWKVCAHTLPFSIPYPYPIFLYLTIFRTPRASQCFTAILRAQLRRMTLTLCATATAGITTLILPIQ